MAGSVAAHIGWEMPVTPPLPSLASGRLPAARIRRLRPEDERLYPDFLAHVSAEDRRFRFFSAAELTPHQISRFTRYDPASAVALAAVSPDDGALWGVARLHRLDGPVREGEFAVLVRTDMKGHGIGRALMEGLCRGAPTIGVERVVGLILSENAGMMAFARELGFDLTQDPADPNLVRASARLGENRQAA